MGGKLIAPFSLINRTVSTINKDSPRMLDGGVRRERAERVSANEIRFIMTFVEVSAKQFDHSNWENNIRPWAKTKLLAQPDTQDLLKQGIKLVYRFSGNDGKQVDEFSLSPGDLNL